uniref:Uncharacterized protein n=1 Tax=Anopheles atroparvus TaxID=41427 RepID=A0AAG5D203_ANOAO
MLHAHGPTDYIRQDIVGGIKLLFKYQAGTGTLKVYRGDEQPAEQQSHALRVDAFHLNSTLTIGVTLDYRYGYVGSNSSAAAIVLRTWPLRSRAGLRRAVRAQPVSQQRYLHGHASSIRNKGGGDRLHDTYGPDTAILGS